MDRNLIRGKNSIILYCQNYHKCTLGFAKLRNKHSYDDLKYGNELHGRSSKWGCMKCDSLGYTRRTSVAWLPKLKWFSCFHPEDPAEFVNKSNIFVFVLALFSHSKNFSCYLRQRARWKTRILDLLTKFCRVFKMKTAESLELAT